jgi:hypothetical protein
MSFISGSFKALAGYDSRDATLMALAKAQGDTLTRKQILQSSFESEGLPEFGLQTFKNDDSIRILPIPAIAKIDRYLIRPVSSLKKAAGMFRYMAAGAAFAKKSLHFGHSKEDVQEISQIMFLNNFMLSPYSKAIRRLLVTSYLTSSLLMGPAALAAFVLTPVSVGLLIGGFDKTAFKAVMLNQAKSLVNTSYRKTTDHEHTHTTQTNAAIHSPDMFADRFKTYHLTLTGQNNLNKYTNNLCNDMETQVRLHEVLRENRKRWGRLPVTRDELWLALEDAGIKIPASIRTQISSQAVSDLKPMNLNTGGRLTKTARRSFDTSTAELALVASVYSRTPESQYAFWTQTLPYMYGHLVKNSYEISDGFERMNISPNLPEQIIIKTKDIRDSRPTGIRMPTISATQTASI